MARKETIVKVASWTVVVALLFFIEFLTRMEDTPVNRMVTIALYALVALFVVFGMPYIRRKTGNKEPEDS